MTTLDVERNALLESEENPVHKKMLRDWHQALRTPHIYRVGSRTLRIQNQFLAFILLIFIVTTFMYGFPLLQSSICTSSTVNPLPSCHYYTYNKTYPFTSPLRSTNVVTYAIAAIADLDTDSKVSNKKETWRSVLKKGHLTWMPTNNLISVTWEEGSINLESSLAMKGRGMELSELITFDGRLLTFDDRTGMVYYIEGDKAFPWVILVDGDGKDSKGTDLFH